MFGSSFISIGDSMRRLITLALAAAALSTATAGVAAAQPHGDDHRDGHPDMHGGHGPDFRDHHWQRGGRIERGDWGRGQRVDWRARHFRAPPRGYEWRYIDGQYVLGAIATGVIADIILNSR
jgi:Ni/Co efflux regulator RcnB